MIPTKLYQTPSNYLLCTVRCKGNIHQYIWVMFCNVEPSGPLSENTLEVDAPVDNQPSEDAHSLFKEAGVRPVGDETVRARR